MAAVLQGNKLAQESAVSREMVEVVLDRVRLALQADGGDLNLVAMEGKNAVITLKGNRAVSLSGMMTLKFGIERALREEVPDFGELIVEITGIGKIPSFDV